MDSYKAKSNKTLETLCLIILSKKRKCVGLTIKRI